MPPAHPARRQHDSPNFRAQTHGEIQPTTHRAIMTWTSYDVKDINAAKFATGKRH
jgi:hypothetical protein